MRFLALETDVGKLKKQFIVGDEEEILTTTHHLFTFVALLLLTTPVWLAVLAGQIFGLLFFEGTLPRVTISISLFLGLVTYLYTVIRAYIRWRFNFLIVTTEKVVVIDHDSFLFQHVNPIHLENIASTRFQSQFFGILRCGIVHISLKEREGGSTREITLDYIPQPDVVTSAIENAIALEKKRSQHQESPEEQLQKVQEVQQKIEESVKQESVAPTVQPPENPVAPKAEDAVLQPPAQ